MVFVKSFLFKICNKFIDLMSVFKISCCSCILNLTTLSLHLVQSCLSKTLKTWTFVIWDIKLRLDKLKSNEDVLSLQLQSLQPAIIKTWSLLVNFRTPIGQICSLGQWIRTSLYFLRQKKKRHVPSLDWNFINNKKGREENIDTL